MPDEAKLERTETGLVPADDGWFVANLADIGWERVEGGGTWSSFEAPSARSQLLGIGVHVLWPGETPGFYHAESNQEGFLVLSGECVAIVEGEERRLRQWDYLHCPPGTAHITIGAGDGPCAIVMVGTQSAQTAGSSTSWSRPRRPTAPRSRSPRTSRERRTWIGRRSSRRVRPGRSSG